MLLTLNICMACIKPHESKYSCNSGAQHFKNISWVVGGLVVSMFLLILFKVCKQCKWKCERIWIYLLFLEKRMKSSNLSLLSKRTLFFPVWNMTYLFLKVFMELKMFLCLLSRTNNFELFGLWTYKYYFFSSLIAVNSFGLALSFQ